ncbi:MAG: hypothetical protein DBY36_05335 [Clostridiales bacterium]|nr:MAG: hypothetical protein DBY36_05335 [Clostridiales bacterium]
MAALNEGYDLEPILVFLPFFDSDISNNIFRKSLEQNANIEVLLMAINPFTDKTINDIVTHKAMDNAISVEAIVGKVFPFVSFDVANKVVEYAIKNNCNSESLINAALPFISKAMADKVVLYAVEKKTNPEVLSTKAFPFVSKYVRDNLNDYIRKSGYEIEHNDCWFNVTETNELTPVQKLEKIFWESGIALNVENLDEDLCLDSLHYISIICEIENEFDAEIPNEVFSENKISSFNDFLQLLTSLKED